MVILSGYLQRATMSKQNHRQHPGESLLWFPRIRRTVYAGLQRDISCSSFAFSASTPECAGESWMLRPERTAIRWPNPAFGRYHPGGDQIGSWRRRRCCSLSRCSRMQIRESTLPGVPAARTRGQLLAPDHPRDGHIIAVTVRLRRCSRVIIAAVGAGHNHGRFLHLPQKTFPRSGMPGDWGRPGNCACSPQAGPAPYPSITVDNGRMAFSSASHWRIRMAVPAAVGALSTCRRPGPDVFFIFNRYGCCWGRKRFPFFVRLPELSGR